MAEERYLNESGLLRFWNTKIKPLIYKKATLQEDLVVKNPRVTVDLDDGYTFPAGSTMEDLFRYLYRHVYEEVQPNQTVILPSVTLQVTIPTSGEVNDTVTYTVKKKSFDQGKIGTCIAPFEEEVHQSRINSGSTEVSGTFKIYSGSTNVPADCTDEPEMSEGEVTGTLQLVNKGTNNIGIYYCGTSEYTKSTAASVTSYNKAASVTGVSSFGASTTSKSACVTGYSLGYYPSFGNISFTSTESSPSTINNLGNRLNAKGSSEFYYGPVDTSQGNDISFEIYFPADFSATVKYWNTITQSWENVNTVTTSGHFATMPAKSDTSRYPNGSLTEGKEYKLIRYTTGEAWGARRYQITLA